MSYILEALKKSEQERQRGSVPNLQSVQTPSKPPARKPMRWIGLVSALLALSAAFFIYLWQPWNTEVSIKQYMTITSKAPVTEAVAPPLSTETVKTLPEPKPPQPKLTQPSVKPKKDATPTAGGLTPVKPSPERNERTTKPVIKPVKPVARQIKPKVVVSKKKAMEPLPADTARQWQKITPSSTSQATVVMQQPHQQQTKIQPDSRPRLPTAAELPVAIQRGLPGIRISAHIYSDKPASRMVIINDKTLREGETVAGGLTIEEITRDGVIFRFQARRFRMSKLKVWRKN